VSGDPFLEVKSVQAGMDKGIVGDGRFYGRKDRSGGPSRRQVSLIAREQIAAHAATLGLGGIAPGAVRANIETTGIELMKCLGTNVKVGGALLHFYQPRTPCPKMDAVAEGLQRLMSQGRQGVMAMVIASGEIKVGDPILVTANEK
jgi:MOSC domain-containing protein YiiM